MTRAVPTRPTRLVRASVFHGRKGRVKNAFRYGADFLLLDVHNTDERTPRLFSRRGFSIWSVLGAHYGDGSKTLSDRADTLRASHLPELPEGGDVLLLTMPTCLGYNFNPVSLWIYRDADKKVRALIAEVNNTSGDRHSYVCAHMDLSPIRPDDTLTVRKVFHVSPFLPVDGGYRFQFSLSDDAVRLNIGYRSDTDDGLTATLDGMITPLTNVRILASVISLPFSALRVTSLILWQALKLKLKGAQFRMRPQPPAKEVSQ